MKCCYTEMVIKSDDEYRTRFECLHCKKSKYQLKDRSSKVESTKDSLKDGSVLLVDGSPYIQCENEGCGQIVRLHDSKKIRLFVPFTKPEKNIFDGWEKLTPTYEWVQTYTGWVRTVRERSRMVILSVVGCTDCWNHQDSESRKLGRPHIYGASNQPVSEKKVDTKAINKIPLKPLPIVMVVPTRWETAGATKVQRWGQTRESVVPEEKELKKDLYGPYKDRKGK
jgi:hypothetical protein